jgi:DNA-binding transcriptional LysR family regulator
VQRHKKLRCSLLLYDRVVNLLEEGIDVGIRIGALDDSSLVAQPLASLRHVVVASPDFLRRHGTPRHPRDLLTANCVRFQLATGSAWTFRENGKPFSVNVAGNLDFNHAAPAVEACASGLGFGMFISYQVAPALRAKRLKIVLEKFEPPQRPVSVVYPHARLLPARTKAFIAWMKQELRDLKA